MSNFSSIKKDEFGQSIADFEITEKAKKDELLERALKYSQEKSLLLE